MAELSDETGDAGGGPSVMPATVRGVPVTPSRRQLIRLLGTGAVTGLAGCAQNDPDKGGPTPTPSPGRSTPGEQETDTPTETQRPVRKSATIAIFQDPGTQARKWGGVRPDWVRIFDPLVYPTTDLEAAPWLATDWQRTGDLTWEFSLREGVTFHHGKPLRADAVVFTFDTLLQEEVWQNYFNIPPDGVRRVDDMTVEITTSQPIADFPPLIAYPLTGIQHPDRSYENPIGTGPYKYEDHLPRQYVKVSAFEDHWNGPPRMEKLTFRVIFDRNTRVQALKGNNVDVAVRIPTSQYNAVKNADGLTAITQERPNSSHIQFNTAKPPTDDVKLRKALNYAVSQEDLVAAAKNGIGTPANGFVPTVVPWSAESSLPSFGPDTAKAKQLVEESSYDGETLTIVGKSGGRFSSEDPVIAQVVSQSAGEIGVDMEIKLMAQGAFNDASDSGDAGHLWLTGSGTFRASTLFLVRGPIGTYWKVPSNIPTTMPETIDRIKALVAKAADADDPAVKGEALRKVQHILVAEKVVFLPCYYRTYVLGTREKIGEFDWPPIVDTARWENLEYYK